MNDERQLFGGAMTMCLPDRLVDVSDFRPVPDNQEVLADGATDQSVIIEIMEHSQAASREHIPAEYYYKDLAATMESETVELSQARQLSSGNIGGVGQSAAASLAVGKEAVSKGRQGRDAANIVLMALVAIQIPSMQSDILVTLYTPQYINPSSASADHAGSRIIGEQEALELLMSMLSSLKVHDWSLFTA